jgi:hypothetical protein
MAKGLRRQESWSDPSLTHNAFFVNSLHSEYERSLRALACHAVSGRYGLPGQEQVGSSMIVSESP